MQFFRGRQNLFQLGNRLAQLVGLGLQFQPGKLGQTAQPQLQNELRLGFGQIEYRHQTLAGGGGIIGGPNDLDDFIQVQHGNEQSIDQMQAFLFFL